MQWLKVVLLVWLALWVISADAHKGRTDSSGCHIEKKTGIRHCH